MFQAEDGIRDLVRSRGLGDVYKRQAMKDVTPEETCKARGHIRTAAFACTLRRLHAPAIPVLDPCSLCLLYTSDAADERSSVDLGGRRILKKQKQQKKKKNTHSNQ